MAKVKIRPLDDRIVVEPSDAEITAAQTNWLTNHINTFESALYGANFTDPDQGYAKYIDVDSWIDTWILVETTKNIDGFRLSTYYHKDVGGKITQGPAWDFNLSLANANDLQGAYPAGWYHRSLSRGDYPYWDRLFDDPNFEIRVRDRWFELRNTIFSTENLLGAVDEAVGLLADGNPNLGDILPGEPSNPISRESSRDSSSCLSSGSLSPEPEAALIAARPRVGDGVRRVSAGRGPWRRESEP